MTAQAEIAQGELRTQLWEQVRLYRRLTTLCTDVPLAEGVTDLEWRGAHEGLRKLCLERGASDLPDRITHWISEP